MNLDYEPFSEQSNIPQPMTKFDKALRPIKKEKMIPQVALGAGCVIPGRRPC
jgi:hypothetical protein